MKRIVSCLIVLTFLVVLAVPAGVHASNAAAGTADGMIRVWLASMSGKNTFNVTVSGSYKVMDATVPDGRTVKVEFQDGNVYLTNGDVRTNMGTSFTLVRASGGLKIAESASVGNVYPGSLTFTYSSGTAYVICTMYVEDYVYGVLPYEIDSAFPSEALKAQAIIARTYAMKAKKSSGLYDLTDQGNHQTFRGVDYGKTSCIQATDATKGITITYNGGYIEPYYCASNGGQTELNSNAWSSTTAGYLQSKNDPYDLANTRAISKSYLIFDTPLNGSSVSAYNLISSAIAAKLGGSANSYTVNRVTNVAVETPKYAAPSQLYTTLKVTALYNTNQTIEVDIPIFPDVKSGLNLGINSANNELFTVARESDGYRITSRRYGHGVGLSQRGAEQMANTGMTYAQILNFYYSNVQLPKKELVASSATGGTSNPSASQEETGVASGTAGRVTLQNTTSRLNLRQTPDANSAIVARIPHGTDVTVLGETGSWYQIQYGLQTGYASKVYIALQQTSTETNPSNVNATVNISSGYLSMRSSASATATIIGSIPNAAAVKVLESGSTWSQVTYGAVTGYVLSQYLSTYQQPTPLPTGNSALVSLADPIGGSLNLRAYPSTSAPVLKHLRHGTTVQVLDRQSVWTKISADGIVGYVMNTYLIFEGASPIPTTSPLPTVPPTTGVQSWRASVNLTSGNLNLRSQPNLNASIVARIPNRSEVLVTKLGDTWCEIIFGNYTGYVMQRYLQISGNSIQTTSNPSATAAPTSATGSVAVAWTQSGVGNVNMRNAPNTNSDIIVRIPHGSQVTVLQVNGDWTYAQYQQTTGYISSAYLRLNAAPPYATATPLPTSGITPTDNYAYAVTQSGVGNVNLRATPSTGGDIVAKIPHGSRVQVLQYANDWTYVSFGSFTGYVASQYLSGTQPGTGGVIIPTAAPNVVILNTGTVALTSAADTVPLRAAASDVASVVATLPHGTRVDVLEYTGAAAQWVYVRSGASQGYALRQYFAMDNQVVYVNTTDAALSVYTAANADSAVQTTLANGAVVSIVAKINDEWVQIRMNNGTTGFARASGLSAL